MRVRILLGVIKQGRERRCVMSRILVLQEQIRRLEDQLALAHGGLSRADKRLVDAQNELRLAGIGRDEERRSHEKTKLAVAALEARNSADLIILAATRKQLAETRELLAAKELELQGAEARLNEAVPGDGILMGARKRKEDVVPLCADERLRFEDKHKILRGMVDARQARIAELAEINARDRKSALDKLQREKTYQASLLDSINSYHKQLTGVRKSLGDLIHKKSERIRSQRKEIRCLAKRAAAPAAAAARIISVTMIENLKITVEQVR